MRIETVSRFSPALPIWRVFVLPLLVLSGSSGQAVDLGPWARHVRQYGEWTSLDFRHPVTGLFLAARAGTEDPSTNATLTLTAAPAQGCGAETVIVRKTGKPAISGTERTVRLTIRVDGLAAKPLQARFVMPRGDSFAYAQLLEELPLDSLKNHETLAVEWPRVGQIRFSLKGFESAWTTAQDTCRAFLPH